MSNNKYNDALYIANLKKFKQKIKVGQICNICGEQNPNLLEFAHYDRKCKSVNFSSATIQKMKEELSKGRFLCVWCHRLETKKEIESIKDINLNKWKYDGIIVEPDINARKCNGPMCKGIIRNSGYFYVNSNGKLRSICKNCTSYNARIRRDKIIDFVNDEKIKIGKCNICNIIVNENNTTCFDFDHIDQNNKVMTISNMTLQEFSKENIFKEMSKCQLLCCKCHRLRTMEQLNHVNYETYNYDEDIKNINMEHGVIKKMNKPKVKEYKCQDCDINISRGAKRCLKCHGISRRKTNRPDINILLKEISCIGYEGVGKKYGVSGNAIKKWVK